MSAAVADKEEAGEGNLWHDGQNGDNKGTDLACQSPLVSDG